jgi:ER membrane protein complex subunit 1, C-terminal
VRSGAVALAYIAVGPLHIVLIASHACQHQCSELIICIYYFVIVITDVFCTRVTPSKTFDLLAPTFNYGLLLLVIALLTAGNIAAGIASKRKLLAAQWA